MIETEDEIKRVLELCRVKNLAWNENKKSLRDTIHQRIICNNAQQIAIKYNQTITQTITQTLLQEEQKTEDYFQIYLFENPSLIEYQTNDIDKTENEEDEEDEENEEDEKNILKFHSLIDVSNETSIVEQYIKYNIIDILPDKILCHDIWENSSYNIDSSLYNIWDISNDERNSQIIYNSIW